jgi:hypothetical protein
MPGASYSFILSKTLFLSHEKRESVRRIKKAIFSLIFVIIIGFLLLAFLRLVLKSCYLLVFYLLFGNYNIFTCWSWFLLVFFLLGWSKRVKLSCP